MVVIVTSRHTPGLVQEAGEARDVGLRNSFLVPASLPFLSTPRLMPNRESVVSVLLSVYRGAHGLVCVSWNLVEASCPSPIASRGTTRLCASGSGVASPLEEGRLRRLTAVDFVASWMAYPTSSRVPCDIDCTTSVHRGCATWRSSTSSSSIFDFVSSWMVHSTSSKVPFGFGCVTCVQRGFETWRASTSSTYGFFVKGAGIAAAWLRHFLRQR